MSGPTLDARLLARALARAGCGAGLALLAGDGPIGALLLGGALAGTALVERLALAWARRAPGRRWRAAAAATLASAALLLAALAHLVALHDAGSPGLDAGAASMGATLGALRSLGLLGALTLGCATLVVAAPAGASLLLDLDEGGPAELPSTWLVLAASLAGLLPTLVALGGVRRPAGGSWLANVAISLVVGFPIAFVGAAALEVGLLVALLLVDAAGDLAARLVPRPAEP